MSINVQYPVQYSVYKVSKLHIRMSIIHCLPSLPRPVFRPVRSIYMSFEISTPPNSWTTQIFDQHMQACLSVVVCRVMKEIFVHVWNSSTLDCLHILSVDNTSGNLRRLVFDKSEVSFQSATSVEAQGYGVVRGALQGHHPRGRTRSRSTT